MRYLQIERLFQDYPVRRVCQLLDVAPSGYYRYVQQHPSRHARDDASLLTEIRRLFLESHETYGSPRIHAALQHAGFRVARKRVERLMREHKIVPHMVKRMHGATKRNPKHPKLPNLLQQNFVAPAPNRVWLTDTTWLQTQEGVYYLSTVEDLFSRRIIGWSTAPSFDTNLITRALHNALALRRFRPGQPLELIHHSDQGSQYTSFDYQELLKRFGLTSSTSDRGNAYDNAPMESFFATLKKEWLHGHTFVCRTDLDAALFDFIEPFYNRFRLHSALDYRSPVDFEATFFAQSVSFPSKVDTLPSTTFQEAVAFCPPT